MSDVTLLPPKSKFPLPVVFWKKFGDQPKSTSNPTAPAPIQASDAPKSPRFSNSSSKSPTSPKFAAPPQLMPTKGVKSQSADAVDGTAAEALRTKTVVVSNLRMII